MTKRYLGNIITQNPTAPSGPYENSTASGVWSLAEAFAYSKAGLWPTAGNTAQYGLFIAGEGAGTSVSSVYINTLGNAVDFGDVSANSDATACLSSATRAIAANVGGGTNTIEYIEFSTGGNSIDFGDLTVVLRYASGASNSTRGIFAGGNDNQGFDPSNYLYEMSYITIASAGNATFFGDLTQNRRLAGGTASPTRAVFMGGSQNVTEYNNIDYVTIATTGNAADFGDITVSRYQGACFGSDTRGLFAGGGDAAVNTIDYITIASTGNATDFGDLITGTRLNAGCSSNVRGLSAGGVGEKSIEYVTIASTGNATDFGDLLQNTYWHGSCSNVHGGLAA